MAVKLVICVCAFLIQNIATQCIGAYNVADSLALETLRAPWAPACYAQDGYAYAGPIVESRVGLSPANLAASNGGGLIVTSSSPIAPTGVSMTSENAYEGYVALNGALPFLAAASLEGVLPTAGAGTVIYGCGDGSVGILSEDISAGYEAEALAYAANAGLGYNGLARPLGAVAGPISYNSGGYGGCSCGAY